jgi:hypothetical protein
MEKTAIHTITGPSAVNLLHEKSYASLEIASMCTLPPPPTANKVDASFRRPSRRLRKTPQFVIGALMLRGYTPANKNGDYLAFGDTMHS